MLKEFFSCLWSGVSAMAARIFQRGDVLDKREGAAFEQSMQINERIIARIEKVEARADSLTVQNAEQAAQMRVQQRQIDECREHHKKCEEDRLSLTKRLNGIERKVDEVGVKVESHIAPPETK